MTAVCSVIEFGAAGIIIESECHLSNNLPTIVIVGLGGKTIDESKERIRSAFANSNTPLPRKRITINLAPADIPKTTTALDLAIAVSILQAASPRKYTIDSKAIFMGELGLDGSVRPIRGIIGKIRSAQEHGYTAFFIPERNSEQALLVTGVEIYAVATFKALRDHLDGTKEIGVQHGQARTHSPASMDSDNLLSSIVGQQQAKRALTIAAAGGHNVMLYGPPGTGKSMLAKALPSLLPPLTHEEMLEVTHIHSLTTPQYDQLVSLRPVRSPHHTASYTSIIGGGSTIRPGEITLSHRGVLILDEFPEFSRSTLEALRQPLEDRQVTITRVKQSVQYPANFILITTANPCPCGYYGSDQQCICTPHLVQSYQHKLSGPLLDRIDIHVSVSSVDYNTLLQSTSETDELDARISVMQARNTQRLRNGPLLVNADLTNQQLGKYVHARDTAITLLNTASKRLHLSARAYMRALKVARTIADLDASEDVTTDHISEALRYRKNQLTID